MLGEITFSILATLLASSGIAGAKPDSDAAAPTVRLTGDEVTIPLTLVGSFPFIEGKVNGIKGKFMFDTGAPFALTLNEHRFPLHGGVNLGGDKVGSGQTLRSRLNKTVASVQFAQFSYTDVHEVQSDNAVQLEKHVTPDFLGWIGFEFFRGYAIKVDYRKRTLTFYKTGPASTTRFLEGERVVAVVPFQQRKLPRIPIVQVEIGHMLFDGPFDTGAYGELWIDAATRQKLASEGNLTVARGKDANGRVDVAGIHIGSGAAALGLRFNLHSQPFVPARAIGVRSENVLTFAFNLLSKYKTVWDYPNHRIYLLSYDDDTREASREPGSSRPTPSAPATSPDSARR